ncbi:MAG: hypothetical protein ACE37H_02685 [Phycisphaeraceae bacterium]
MLKTRLILLLLIALQPASLVGLSAHAQLAGGDKPPCCEVVCCPPGQCDCEMLPAPSRAPAIPAEERDATRPLCLIQRALPGVVFADQGPGSIHRYVALPAPPLAVARRLSLLCLWLT